MDVDVVVVGSGAGGLSAALTAAIEGLQVLVLEKTDRIGGTTAISGGAMWIPLTDKGARAAGPDSMERVWQYLRHVLGADLTPEPLQAYLAAGPRMVDYFERHTSLRFQGRAYSPDYDSDAPGAALGGRTLDPAEFDGRDLKRAFRDLRDPLREFTVLGGMMVTLTDVYNLLAIHKSWASCRQGARLLGRYALDRLRGYHRGTRLVLGNALAGRLLKSVRERQIPYWLEAPVTELLRSGDRVTGVVARHRGQRVEIRASKAVVIATGGFPWDSELRETRFPKPTASWSMASPGNSGDGIRLARACGAQLGPQTSNPAFWAPVSALERADGTHQIYPHFVWDRAKPGLIAVDQRGRRFVNEASSYHAFVQAMYRSHQQAPCIPATLICDHDFIEKWGLGLALPGGRPRRHLVKAGYLIESASLAQLAAQLGVKAQVLDETVSEYNAFAQQGDDPHFGKGSTDYNRHLGDPSHQPNPCLAPLRTPPFYAVKVYPGDIGTACGLRTDTDARVLDASGAVVEGLYAVGNDMQSVMNGHYPGAGITLGAALTFGWIAGMRIANGASPVTPQRATSAPSKDLA